MNWLRTHRPHDVQCRLRCSGRAVRILIRSSSQFRVQTPEVLQALLNQVETAMGSTRTGATGAFWPAPKEAFQPPAAVTHIRAVLVELFSRGTHKYPAQMAAVLLFAMIYGSGTCTSTRQVPARHGPGPIFYNAFVGWVLVASSHC